MTLKYIPMPHQIEDSDILVDYQDGLLWADPGTGKTFTAILGMQKVGFDRVVVVCPRIAVDMWVGELKDHLGWDAWRVMSRSRSAKNGGSFFWRRAIVVTYDLLARNSSVVDTVSRYLSGYEEVKSSTCPPWGTYNSLLLLDEAHYIKNKDSKRAAAVLGPDKFLAMGMRRHAASLWQLTGTPITRYVDDLYAQLITARRDVMRAYGVETYDAFVKAFCITDMRKYGSGPPKRVVVGNKNLTRLNGLLSDCAVIKRKLGDVIEHMPKITYRVVGVDYKNVEHVVITDVDKFFKELSDPNSGMSKAWAKLGVAKVSGCSEYIKSLSRGPMLVGFWHTDVGHGLRSILEDSGMSVGYIDGSTSDAARVAICAEFNAGRLDVLLGQIKALGVAANLQEAADTVIMAEEVASPSDLQQFIARVYRGGQTRHVQVDMIRTDHAIDEALAMLRGIKATGIAKVF